MVFIVWYMTLCIAALTPSGIILTADSRQTYRNNAGMARIGTDNAVKLFKLTQKSAVVISGRAFFPDSQGVVKNAGWFIEEFKKSLKMDSSISVREIAQQLNDFLIKVFFDPEEVRAKIFIQNEIGKMGGSDVVIHPRQASELPYSYIKDGQKIDRTFYVETISFIVAGYDQDGIGRAFFVVVPGSPSDPLSRNTQSGGQLNIGQNDVMLRIVKGFAAEFYNSILVLEAKKSGLDVTKEMDKMEYIINWGSMTMQDSIDFCVLMTRITESVQRFSDGTFNTPGGITGVGGAIDIAKITPEDDFQWIRKKELVVDDR